MAYLYHVDPYRRSFDSAVVRCEPLDGERMAVVLEDTCFYPGGGGQPCDLGTLDGLAVEEVFQKEEDGPVTHVLRASTPLTGRVHGEIDWARRYDHMQQHTGQHLLSYAISQRFGGYSLGLHVGAQDAYVDVRTELESVSPELAAQLEADVDALVAADLPVHQFFPSQEELAALPLRKAPPFHPHLRIVHCGPEAVACCGTHLSSTGQVRLVHLLGSARSHGNLRLFFLAGDRALRHARLCMAQAQAAAVGLSCGLGSLAEMVERLKAETQAQRRDLASLKREQALARLRNAGALVLGGVRAVIETAEGLEPKQLQEAASALLKEGAGLVCLAAPGNAGVTAVVAADGPDAGAAFRALAGRFGGKGGGRRDFAQGLLQGFGREDALACLAAWLGDKAR